jgi:hypothetical protein
VSVLDYFLRFSIFWKFSKNFMFYQTLLHTLPARPGLCTTRSLPLPLSLRDAVSVRYVLIPARAVCARPGHRRSLSLWDAVSAGLALCITRHLPLRQRPGEAQTETSREVWDRQSVAKTWWVTEDGKQRSGEAETESSLYRLMHIPHQAETGEAQAESRTDLVNQRQRQTETWWITHRVKQIPVEAQTDYGWDCVK